MPLTEDDIIEVIIAEIGDVDPVTGDYGPADPDDGVLASFTPTAWEMYAAKDSIAPGLRALYTRRDSLRRVMAVGMQKWFDTADNLSGLSIRGSQIYKHYQDMYDCAKKEIEAVEKAVAQSSGGAVGLMTTTYLPAPADRTEQYIRIEEAFEEAAPPLPTLEVP